MAHNRNMARPADVSDEAVLRTAVEWVRGVLAEAFGAPEDLVRRVTADTGDATESVNAGGANGTAWGVSWVPRRSMNGAVELVVRGSEHGPETRGVRGPT